MKHPDPPAPQIQWPEDALVVFEVGQWVDLYGRPVPPPQPPGPDDSVFLITAIDREAGVITCDHYTEEEMDP